MRRAGREDGDIITGWLLQLVMILAVIGFVVYEVVAVGVATVSLDDQARDIIRVTRDSYRADRSLPAARAAAEASVAGSSVEVESVEEEAGELVITLSKRARTLLIHRVAPLEDLATTSTTRRVRWQS